MDNEKRKEMAAYLKWGDTTKIAKLAKVSRRTVEGWLSGSIKKSVVEPYFVALVNKRKEQVDREVEELFQAETLN